MCSEDLNAEWLFGDIGCYGEFLARRGSSYQIVIARDRVFEPMHFNR
jgi:hypothetical protein